MIFCGGEKEDADAEIAEGVFRRGGGTVVREPAARMGKNNELAAQLGNAELEEMARQIAILAGYDLDKFRAYLEARRENLLGTYWEDFVTKAGLPAPEIKAKAQSDATQAALKKNSQLATDVNARGEITFLVNNREIAQVRDKDDFRRLLDYLKG